MAPFLILCNTILFFCVVSLDYNKGSLDERCGVIKAVLTHLSLVTPPARFSQLSGADLKFVVEVMSRHFASKATQLQNANKRASDASGKTGCKHWWPPTRSCLSNRLWTILLGLPPHTTSWKREDIKGNDQTKLVHC